MRSRDLRKLNSLVGDADHDSNGDAHRRERFEPPQTRRITICLAYDNATLLA
jgi:hypothetical protein